MKPEQLQAIRRLVTIKEQYLAGLVLWLTAVGGLLALSLSGIFLNLDRIRHSSSLLRWELIGYVTLLSIAVVLLSFCYVDLLVFFGTGQLILLQTEQGAGPSSDEQKCNDKEMKWRTTRLRRNLWAGVAVSMASIGGLLLFLGEALLGT